MKTLYIGCALNNAPVEFIQFIEQLKGVLTNHFNILSFVGLDPQATAKQVYETDIACAFKADVMLAVVDFPSIGLGMEIQHRIHHHRPTLIMYAEGLKVSRMVLGAAEDSSCLSTVSYKSVDDIVNALHAYE